MTFDLEATVVQDSNSVSTNTNSTVPASNLFNNESSEVGVAGKAPVNIDFMEAKTQSAEPTEESRSPDEDVRSPAPQQRTTESLSVFHTPETFNSPMPSGTLDLGKVRSVLSELNAVVQEEEHYFFQQLTEAESANAILRQHVATNYDLRETNLKLEKSVEAAQIMMGKLQKEAQSRVASLTDSLVSKDVEIAKLRAESETVNSQLQYQVSSTNALRETNTKLQKSVEAAQIMMSTARQEVQAKHAEISKIQVQAEKATELEEANVALQRMVEDLEGKIEDLEGKIDHIQTENQGKIDHIQTENQARVEEANAKLQKTVEELKAETVNVRTESQGRVEKLVEAFEGKIDKIRTDSQARVDALNESLVSKDVEMAKLQAEYRVISESKSTEMALMKKLVETQEEEGKKLRAAAKTSSESLLAQEAALGQLRTEFETLQASFDSIKREKDDIEQGHEDAKEKWKRLVITMKSEYDSFRASFEHLKASKKEMEETYGAEKGSLEQSITKLQSENESLTAEIDSLKISKEMSANKFQEAAQSWEKTKEEQEAELARLHAFTNELNENVQTLSNTFEERVRSQVEPTEMKFAAIMAEFGQVKSDMYALEQVKQDIEQVNAYLKASNETLSEELEMVKQELKTEVRKHYLLQEKHGELTADYSSKVSECDALKLEIEKMETAKEEADKDNEALSEANEKVTAELEDIKGQLACVENEKSEAEMEIVNLKGEKAELTANIESIRSSMEGAKIVYRDEKKKFEKKITKLTKTVETKKEALTLGLGKYLTELKLKEKAEKELVKLNDTAKKFEAELDGAEKRIVALEDVIKFKDEDHKTTLKFKDDDHKTKLAELEDVIKFKDADHKTKLAELEDVIKFKDEDHKTTLAKLNADHKTTLAKLNADQDYTLAKLNADHKNTLEKLNADHKTTLAKLNEKVESSINYEASQREIALQAQIMAETKLSEVEKQLNKTNAELLSAKCQGDSLRAEVQKLERTLHEEVHKLEGTLLEEVNKLEGASIECRSLKETLARVEKAKQETEEGLAKAQAENKRAKKEAEELKQKINKLSKSVGMKIAAITALESQCETLKNSIDVNAGSATDAVTKVDFLQQIVSGKEKELELIRSRCKSLETTLEETEDKLAAKAQVERELDEENAKVQKELEEVCCKATETQLLVEKKNKELQTIQERCEKLQTALKKAETLYLDGVETIKAEAERKTREALEEATDRAYVLNGLLARREEELAALKERLATPRAGPSNHDECEGSEASSDGEAKRIDEFKSLLNKINFLDGLVSSKDSELELVKMRCEDLQKSVSSMKEAHERQVALVRDEAEKNVSKEYLEKETELKALNREIAQRQSKLKSLKAGDEFEIILDNGDDDISLKEEVQALKMRCSTLELELEKSHAKSSTLEAVMNESTSEGASEQWKFRCDELQHSLDKMTKYYQEECERRKEAEQIFATLSQKPSDDNQDSGEPESNRTSTARGVFGRYKPTNDQYDSKKPSRWLPLRGRKKKEELSIQVYTDTLDESDRGSPSKWWAQSQYSPRRRTFDSMTQRTFQGSNDNIGKESILAQIPTHVKSNFYEVGIYKERQKHSYLPVLCLGPFDIPPGRVRDDWLSKFDGSSKVLCVGVFFLGKEVDDEEAFGTVPWFNFIPFDKAVARGVDMFPREIAAKIDGSQELTVEEKQLCDGLQAMREVAATSKEDRARYLLSRSQAKLNVPKSIVTESVSADDQVSDMGI